MSEPGEPSPKPPVTLLPVSELVDSLVDEMQACTAAWHEVTVVKTNTLDPTTVQEVALAEMQYQNEAPDRNRSDRRGQGGIQHYVRVHTQTIQACISLGQGAASWVKYGTSQQQEQAAQNISQARQEKRDAELGLRKESPVEMYAGNAYLEVYDTYTHALECEERLLEPILRWVSSSPNSLPTLLQWLDSEDADVFGEHMAFVRALARLQFDPIINSFVDQHLENMREMPKLMQNTFAMSLIEASFGESQSIGDGGDVAEGYEEDTDVSWTRFLPVILRECGVDIDAATLGQVLGKLPVKSWPISLQLRLQQEHNARIDILKKQLDEALEPFSRPDRFLVFEPPYKEKHQQPRAQTGRKKKNKGSRASEPSNGGIPETTAKLEPVQTITGAYALMETPEGYTLVAIEPSDTNNGEEEPTVTDLLLNSKECSAYLKKYAGDDRIAGDLQDIITSICKTPRGDGAIKMIGYTASVIVPSTGQRKKLPLWELNPKKRPELNAMGELGTDTRIFYAVVGNGDGTESIALYKVRHKNETVSYRRATRH